MARKKKRQPTWLEVFASRVGIRRAGRVASFIVTYAVTLDRWEGDQPPSIEQYAQEWNVSLATAYRDLALFREAQPFFVQPAGFIAHVGTDLAAVLPAGLRGELA